jgi:hypothetical protein
VSNIIADCKKRLDGYDPEALKDLSKTLSEENITPSQCAIGFRIVKMIIEMGGDEEEIEALLSSFQKEYIEKKVPPSKVVPSLQASIEFSAKERIALPEVPDEVTKYRTELENPRADIEAAETRKKKTLQDAKLTEETVRDFVSLNSRLNAVGLTTKAPDAIGKTAINITALGGDSKKIFAQFSRIESFQSVEKRHQQKCEYWINEAKSYKQIYQVARWFVLNGYLPRDLDLLQHIINEITRREGITPEQAKHKLLMVFISYATLDGLIRQVDWINEWVSVLNDEHNKLKDSLIAYRYFADVILVLFIEIGFTKTKEVVDAMRKVLVSQYYRCNP